MLPIFERIIKHIVKQFQFKKQSITKAYKIKDILFETLSFITQVSVFIIHSVFYSILIIPDLIITFIFFILTLTTTA